MFDVGFSELVLLAMIGLLVLGPKRLPKVAGELGKWVGSARRTASQLYRELERETKLDDVVERKGPKLRVVSLRSERSAERMTNAAPKLPPPEEEEQLAESSLISHLLELRSRILKALVVVIVVFVCLAPFAGRVFELVSAPLSDVLPGDIS